MIHLFVIGDSISLDYGPHLAAALPSDIAYSRKTGEDEAYRNLDIPRGANGGDSRMVRDYLAALAATGGFHADVLLLNCGLHDLKLRGSPPVLQVPADEYRANLHAILDIARPLVTRILWVRTTPIDDALHAARNCGFDRLQAHVDLYNQIADEVMTNHNVPVIPLDRFTASLAAQGPILRDGVHFLKPAQEAQGRYLATQILRLLS